MLIDSHAHLGMPQFNGDRDEVIQRAIDADVELELAVKHQRLAALQEETRHRSAEIEELRSRRSAVPQPLYVLGEWATIRAPTSSMWTRGRYATGNPCSASISALSGLFHNEL